MNTSTKFIPSKVEGLSVNSQKAMPAGRQGFAHILIVLAGVGIATLLGIALWANFQHGNPPFQQAQKQLIFHNDENKGEKKLDHDTVIAQLPSCAESPFNRSPILEDRFEWITPLGNVNPSGGHVTPTDHLYFLQKRDGGKIDIFAPGDITIYEIFHNSVYDQNHKLVSDDFAIDFSPCNKIEARFGHVKSISQALEKEVEVAKKECGPDYQAGKWTASPCRYFLKYQAKAGEVIGAIEAKEGAPAFDFNTYDKRKKPLNFVNPKRYLNKQLYTVCGLDLFEPQTKSMLNSHLGGYGGKRTIEPLCGSIMQDITGTAQGNWFNGSEDDQTLENKGLAISLFHDNVDPSIGIVSIGTSFAGGGAIIFSPHHSGTVNREFSEIKPDNNIYCYQNEDRNNMDLKGIVIMQLLDADKLKIEYQQGSCDSNVNFISPAIYQR